MELVEKNFIIITFNLVQIIAIFKEISNIYFRDFYSNLTNFEKFINLGQISLKNSRNIEKNMIKTSHNHLLE